MPQIGRNELWYVGQLVSLDEFTTLGLDGVPVNADEVIVTVQPEGRSAQNHIFPGPNSGISNTGTGTYQLKRTHAYAGRHNVRIEAAMPDGSTYVIQHWYEVRNTNICSSDGS